MKKKFKPIPGDEQATTDAFVEYVGGRARAERLFSIYRNSYPIKLQTFTTISKREVFCRKAEREGFDKQEIDALLSIQ
jgi:hypothetical protein